MTQQQELVQAVTRVRTREAKSLQVVAMRSHDVSLRHRARTPERSIWVDLSWAAQELYNERMAWLDPQYCG